MTVALLRPADRPAAPVRIAHLGLGAFARAHSVWYTDRVDDDREWGIAAFTGRSADAARALAAQGGVYTLVERGPERDRAELITSISRAEDGSAAEPLGGILAGDAVALLTLTITEAGYAIGPDAPLTASGLGRLALALDRRRAASGAPLALVPCDNLAANGAALGAALAALAERHLPSLGDWLATSVSIVSTSVDRITPRPTVADRALVEQLCGYADAAPVVTEPFSDWVLEGAFPLGRPAWERAGACFVADVEPFEQRKLRLLNGAHSLLAAAGMLAGHVLVSEAIADAGIHAQVEAYWDEASRALDADALDLAGYRAALRQRFANPRLDHRLDQIAIDARVKLTQRVVPVAHAELDAGREALASAGLIGSWITAVLTGHDGRDADVAAIATACADHEPVRALLHLIDADLADHLDFLGAVADAVHRSARSTP